MMGGRTSDRLFGLVILVLALAYIASAFQIETSFLADPVGPKTFPVGVGFVAAISAIYMIIKPDADPDWPTTRTFGALAVSTLVLVAYAFLLKPLGFLVPTAAAAGLLSYQISPRIKPAILAGVGLSIGLYLVFRFALGLSLLGFPRGTLGF